MRKGWSSPRGLYIIRSKQSRARHGFQAWHICLVVFTLVLLHNNKICINPLVDVTGFDKGLLENNCHNEWTRLNAIVQIAYCLERGENKDLVFHEKEIVSTRTNHCCSEQYCDSFDKSHNWTAIHCFCAAPAWGH